MWGAYRRVPEELKEKILRAVQYEGIAVSQASREYWVSSQSIHAWLRKEVSHRDTREQVDMREVQRLRKDKEDLLKLIWSLNFELEKTKKKK